MEKSFMKSKEGQGLITAICIIACYICMYGLLALLMNVLDSSTFAFLIFLVISMGFAYKSCKGALANSLSSLPWPVFILLVILLSAVIGCFTAPYHIGKWISVKINHQTRATPHKEKNSKPNENDYSEGSLRTGNDYSESSLRNMSIEELDELYTSLSNLVMPTFGEPSTKRIPFGKDSFGCKTWGEARNLMDLVAKIHNEKLP